MIRYLQLLGKQKIVDIFLNLKMRKHCNNCSKDVVRL